MWKVYLSRWVNYRLLGGRPDQMISSRCYVEHHPRAERFINNLFFWQDNHCKRTFLWEVRNGTSSHKRPTECSEETPCTQQGRTEVVEKCSFTNGCSGKSDFLGRLGNAMFLVSLSQKSTRSVDFRLQPALLQHTLLRQGNNKERTDQCFHRHNLP